MSRDENPNGLARGESSHDLPRGARIVVIGGGVNGLSTAFQLAKRGVRDVVVLERRHLGAGATGKSGALVRCHYANVPEARLTQESLHIFRNWDKEVGAGSPGFTPTGFIQVVAPEHEDRLRQNVADQNAVGIETRLVARDELREIETVSLVFLDVGDHEAKVGGDQPLRRGLIASDRPTREPFLFVRVGDHGELLDVEQVLIEGAGRSGTGKWAGFPGADMRHRQPRQRERATVGEAVTSNRRG